MFCLPTHHTRLRYVQYKYNTIRSNWKGTRLQVQFCFRPATQGWGTYVCTQVTMQHFAAMLREKQIAARIQRLPRWNRGYYKCINAMLCHEDACGCTGRILQNCTLAFFNLHWSQCTCLSNTMNPGETVAPAAKIRLLYCYYYTPYMDNSEKLVRINGESWSYTWRILIL